MSIPDRYNPKKWIGSLGRRYGGKPFQRIRKWYYDTLSLGMQCYETFYLYKGRYAPRHRDTRFYNKYYRENGMQTPGLPEGFICMLDGRRFHGGVTDRIRGILTTYREAKKRGKNFYIYWNDPFPLEDYLTPSEIDWRIAPDKLGYTKEDAFPVIIEDETDLQSRMRMNAAFRLKYPQLHIYSNADNCRGEYRKLFHELFKPSESLEREVKRHLDVLGDKYWSFSFRFLQLLGDFRDRSRRLDEGEARALISKVKEELLKEMKKVPSGYRILVTADSRRFLDEVEGMDPRIYIVPGDIKHIDKHTDATEEVWMKTFVDQMLLMGAERVCLMRTGEMYKSGFSRFAAEVGGAEFLDYEF